jgi:hypothetical protein
MQPNRKELQMDINNAFPSRWLKAENISGPTLATIKSVVLEEMSDEGDKKPVVYFQETELGLVLNKTNANMIALVCKSGNTDDWITKKIGLRQETVQFRGKPVPSIRVFDPQPPKQGGFKGGSLAPSNDNVPHQWDAQGNPTAADDIPDPGDPIRSGFRA